MKIEFLYFEGCPHHPMALALLQDILRKGKVDQPIEMINVDSGQYAQEIRFLGSPSIRIDGKDLEGTKDSPSDYGIKCRIYYGSDGPTGMPPEELLKKSIAMAKKNSS